MLSRYRCVIIALRCGNVVSLACLAGYFYSAGTGSFPLGILFRITAFRWNSQLSACESGTRSS